ncbi:sulfatase family protein [Coraliomargarita parva]|uniref:sulfatase family protein n=1 Tax=Coraliomargarita parva TaxID=3014050 RepID=UPI0022B3F0C6|nr:sulfatase [Coraliomargarita parva]
MASAASTIRNVIYIHTHDMGRYISPYGHAVSTPHLQAFAERSTLFRQAYCCGPTCSPSRAGLLTGMTPHETGMLGLAHRGFTFSRPELHLAAYLKAKGFLTALCGMQHEFNSAWDQMPYEESHFKHDGPAGVDYDLDATKSAIEFLSCQQDRPYFLSYGLFYPHRPFLTADYNVFRPDYMRPPAPLPDTPEIRRDMADYAYTVNRADDCIGQVLETIYRYGHDRNSLIIMTTDHGIAFPGMKCNLTDHGIGVTLMMAAPGNQTAGAAVDALVSHLDIYPTICDLLGLAAPDHLQGSSLRPLLEGTTESIRDEVFSEVTFHAAYEPMRCVRTKRHKLIFRYELDQRPLANCDGSLSKDELLRFDWGSQILPQVELYDLMLDPSEACNRAADPVYADVRQDLERRLLDWMKRTSDPLLDGHVEQPVGTMVNVFESLDPEEGPFLRRM